jgi:hypothetical protein
MNNLQNEDSFSKSYEIEECQMNLYKTKEMLANYFYFYLMS